VTLEAHSETFGGMSREDLKDLTEKAHKICPYSKAINGNVVSLLFINF
jgi:organic hydroperoxide reductase OsmC/OhrA